MIEQLRNLLLQEIDRAIKQKGWPRIGIVDGYNPANHTARVMYLDEEKLTGWLPVGSAWTGNGWGLHFAPQIGAQVVVHHHDGDQDAGFISHQLFSSADMPLPVNAGDFLLQHANGNMIKIDASGNVFIGMNGGTFQALATQHFVQETFVNHTHGNGPKPDQMPAANDVTTQLMAT